MKYKSKNKFSSNGEISCSIIVPVRNESGNIRRALQEIPQMGIKSEIIFIEGHSNDNTWEILQEECNAYNGPHDVSYHKQPGIGKWDAVKFGFGMARGDILVIQDGDLTVKPNDLLKFYDAIVNCDAEFVNGSRLIFPMEKESMRFLNKIGNRVFAYLISKLIHQKIEDTLCGTKMISRFNYIKLFNLLGSSQENDPFGDFSLIFGSALLNLKILNIPVQYYRRTYGKSNISRFKDGIILLKLVFIYTNKLRNKNWSGVK